MDVLVDAAWAESTRKRYSTWWQRCEAFYAGLPLLELGLDELLERLLRFVADLVVGRSYSGAKQAMAALAAVVKVRRGFDLWQHPRFNAMHKGLGRMAAWANPPQPKRDVLPAEALIRFVATPPQQCTRWDAVLIAAVLSVGIRCIRRPGELADLHEDQLVTTPSGAKLVLRFTKADQAAQRTQEVPFEAGLSLADPIACLDRYLLLAKRCSLHAWQGRPRVPLFVDQRGRSLSADRIKDMVRLVAAHAGLQGRFGGHSIRISGATLAVLGGLSLEQVMAIGGWRGPAAGEYLRALVGVALGATTRMGL